MLPAVDENDGGTAAVECMLGRPGTGGGDTNNTNTDSHLPVIQHLSVSRSVTDNVYQ